MHKKTTEQFIIDSQSKWGIDAFDYSKCLYVGAKKDVILWCNLHAIGFTTKPNNHLSQPVSGCPVCSGYRTTNEGFIEESKKVHGDAKYDYSDCEYKSAHKKVKLRCIVHNHRFSVSPANHIRGKLGCTICTSRLKSNERFIEDSTAIHGATAFDYSECEYTGAYEPIKLRCIKHNHKFNVNPSDHLYGANKQGCPICSGATKTTEIFIAESVELHGCDAFDYSMCFYTKKDIPVTLICNKHTHAFDIRPDIHLYYRQGCPKCSHAGGSKLADDWLLYRSELDGYTIRTRMNGGEFTIPGTRFRADGYCQETNTIYEFDGDAYHGNPTRFSSDTKCHPYNRDITAGELHQQTLDRHAKIESLGYRLVSIWESDWLSMR